MGSSPARSSYATEPAESERVRTRRPAGASGAGGASGPGAAPRGADVRLATIARDTSHAAPLATSAPARRPGAEMGGIEKYKCPPLGLTEGCPHESARVVPTVYIAPSAFL